MTYYSPKSFRRSALSTAEERGPSLGRRRGSVRSTASSSRMMRRRSSTASVVTPPVNSKSSLQEWIALRMQREAENYEAARGYISPVERNEISRAVYGILRDNLPPALEVTTSTEELMDIASSIEAKLHDTAACPRAYCAASTLEFRITALATAVLIHSDKGHGGDDISETCARLSLAARKSLVYCVMVLVSYEKRNMVSKGGSSKGACDDGPVPLMTAACAPVRDDKEERMPTVVEEDERAAAEYHLSQLDFCQAVPPPVADYRFEKDTGLGFDERRGSFRMIQLDSRQNQMSATSA